MHERADDRVVAAVHAREHPRVGGVVRRRGAATHLEEAPARAAVGNVQHHRLSAAFADQRGHRVAARPLGDEHACLAFRLDLRADAAHGPLRPEAGDLAAIAGTAAHVQPDDVARPR